jgi:hypothetical protein
MSGRWQHNIPQSLQRGFRIPGGTKKTSQVWLFEKGHAPELQFVKKIAAADDFYSTPSIDGTATLDDQITDYERNSFDRAFQYLKNAAPSSVVDAASAAEVVAHLTIRNDHVRRTFGEAAQRLFFDAIFVFCDETHIRPLLGVDDKTPPARMIQAIDEFLAEHPEFKKIPLPTQVIYRVAHMMLREWFNRSFLECAPQMMMMLTEMVERAPMFVREGHNKALAHGFAPGPRTELLREFAWTVRPSNADGFILPDCVALGWESGKDLQPLMMAEVAESSLVLMPLSGRKMLVGLKVGAAEPTLADFNKAAAICSHRFFIGASKEFADLAPHIGVASKHFMEETIGLLMNQYRKGERPEAPVTSTNPPNVNANDNVSEADTSPPSSPQYTIHFRDCADQATAQRIAANVFALTNKLCRTMPLDRLDGMTFAYDYPAALRDLDRGFTAAPLQPTNEEYGIGVAMAPTVIRNGVHKTHIVLRGEMGHHLIGDHDGDLRLALQTTVQQLERVSSSQIFEEAFPNARIDDHFEAFLYQHADGAWRDYFSARAGASIYPEIGDGYCDIVTAVICRAHRDLVAARLDYHSPNDMDRLMQVALPRVSEILRFSATVLGHYGGRGEPLLENHPTLAATLEQVGLQNWFVLFDGELSDLWARKGNWSSFDEFLTLNRHVERVFWQHGLFPWKADDNRIRVEVRLVTESDKLLLSA